MAAVTQRGEEDMPSESRVKRWRENKRQRGGMMLHTTEQEAKVGGGVTAKELCVENLGKFSVSF
jgi:hypothetical protein